MTRRTTGILLCLASGASFATMAIFAGLAYDDGATVVGVLSLRFPLAAAAFWALVRLAAPPRVSRRDALAALALGAVVYSVEAALFLASLERIDASLAALLLYAYPAIVTVAAIALRRERASRRRVVALLAASTGLVLVMAGARGASLDGLGAALALGAACVYAAYVLMADRLLERMHPLRLAALVCTGAALSYGVVGLGSGRFNPSLGMQAWASIAALALLSTVVAIATSYAGLRRVGPSTASIVSTVEPPITVLLAFLVFGERLAPPQLAGGALVLGAVMVLTAPGRRAAKVRAPWPLPSDRPSLPSSRARRRSSPKATGGLTSPSGTASAPSPSSTATR